MKYHYIDVKIDTSHKASYFIGSTIRGAFGYALKRVTCINPSYQCEGCFGIDECLYYNFYEKKNDFHKYRIDIELGNGKFDFGLYLFNEACDGLPYILSGIETLLSKNGITRNNYTFKNIYIWLNGELIYNSDSFSSINIPPKEFKVDNYFKNIKLKILTPIRIKKNNRFLKDDIELKDILRSIYQKSQEFETGEKAFKLDYTPEYKTILKSLQYKPLLRKSNRQNKRMNMDGIIGEITLMDIDKRTYELLKLGEIIGVGKQTVMGLGKIKVEEMV
jgi:CRISPR-associated endoribonuclease Cas6